MPGSRLTWMCLLLTSAFCELFARSQVFMFLGCVFPILGAFSIFIGLLWIIREKVCWKSGRIFWMAYGRSFYKRTLQVWWKFNLKWKLPWHKCERSQNQQFSLIRMKLLLIPWHISPRLKRPSPSTLQTSSNSKNIHKTHILP